MSKIQEAIDIMKRIIEGGIDNFHAKEKEKEKETINHNKEDDRSNESFYDPHEEQLNETDKELKKQKQIEENFRLHDALDCRLLLEEFRKLFAQKPTSDYEDNATAIIEKLFQEKGPKNQFKGDINKAEEGENHKINGNKKNNFYGNLKGGKNSNSAEIFRLVRNNKNHNTNENCEMSVSNKSGNLNSNTAGTEGTKQDDMVFTNYIKNRLENKDPNEISVKQYNKYKSLLLAFEETKKCLNNPDSSVTSGNTGNNTKSTGFTLSHRRANFNNINNKHNGNYNSNIQYQPQQFQFRSDFYSNTSKGWTKNHHLLGEVNNKQAVNAKNSKHSKYGNSTNMTSLNNSPDKNRTTSVNFYSSKINTISKKIKLR